MALSGSFISATGQLSVFGDAAKNTITLSRDAAGRILINGGAVPIIGGTATVANTTLIQVFGLAGDDIIAMYENTRAAGFGKEVKRRILIGTYVLSHGYYDAYYLQAQKIRRLIARDFAEAFKSCDLIMGPATPCVAYDLGSDKTSDCVQLYLDDLYTIPINLAGLPGMSIPCGFGHKGRPVGLQIVGNYFDEARMLSAAHAFQRATDWHARTPPLFDREP
jgi:aspartyl-tRNA(Asn)/glutamyl-tRNA(Gln) amidotransferase subunit A